MQSSSITDSSPLKNGAASISIRCVSDWKQSIVVSESPTCQCSSGCTRRRYCLINRDTMAPPTVITRSGRIWSSSSSDIMLSTESMALINRGEERLDIVSVITATLPRSDRRSRASRRATSGLWNPAMTSTRGDFDTIAARAAASA